ncbi:MAG TPA: efflux RND transporter permease subunit [Azospirillaceae bacterium]|nr:efflux RND transporter permease subunit [Azospirillaceae bacterium]
MNLRNISATSIRHPVPPVVLFIILTLAGLVSFGSMSITSDPDIDFPIVTVGVSRPGAAPSELEMQVTKKIEDAVSGITGISRVNSNISDGFSNTTLEFKIGYDTDRAVSDVRDAVARVRSDLPQDIYEPQVTRIDVTGDPILYYVLASETRSVEELSWLIDNEIGRTLTRLPGVGEIDRIGGLERQIRINLDPGRLQALGVTADEVNAQLRNLNVDLPGGRGTVGQSEQAIRTLGAARTVEDLRNTEISIPGGRKVRLSDLGAVIDGTSEMRQVSRLDGNPAVGFALSRAPGSSEVTVSEHVKKAIAQLEKDYPDVRFGLVIDTVKFTKESYAASVEAIVLGAILAVAVVWWFLRDMRATLISALAMPLSTIPTFLVMQWFGFTLNGVTMLALALVVGILVDDAIVEIENIVRHIRMGKRPYAAALEAADEIGLAVVATTMTIVVVFLPVSFMPGIAGQFFKSFGVTVAVAVLFSLLVARLITPLMAAYMLTPQQQPEHEGRWTPQYMRVLDWCLTHRWKTIAMGFGFFLLSLVMMAMLPQGFFPPRDTGMSSLNVEMQPGVTIEEADAAVQRVAGLISTRPEVKMIWARAGQGGQIRRGRVWILLKDQGERDLTQKEFEIAVQPMLEQVPGVKASFNNTSGFGPKDISIMLTSDNGPALEKHAEVVLREMQGLPFLANVASTAAMLRPEILIKPRFDLAAEQGVSVASIGRVAKIATMGDIDSASAKFNLGDRQVPIRVQIQDDYRSDLDVIGNLRVRTGSGGTVPLRAVADIEMGAGATQIDRFDRARRISIQADLRGMELGEAMKAINDLPSMRNMPPGISKPKVGGAEEMAIMFKGFMVAMGTAVLLIIAVLVLLFRNFFQPVTILTALLLSIGGAAVALLIANMALSMPALIGILMLMGLVTKNSILLVEYALVSIEERGMSRREALMDAGAKRARPIIMTSIAMIAGMIPIATGLGYDTEFRAPMAVAVIGGLITSTLLSLVIVPAVFTVMDDLQHWLSPKFSRFLTPKEEPAPMRPRIVDAE